jgi:hypothetical protein
MTIGTKSILFGAHAFWFHPFVVAAAWWKTYGFPFDPRLWVAFFVHDLGYIGCPNMDGLEGERHPELGARIMARFDVGRWYDLHRWHDFCLYHSRTYAKLHGAEVSKLCYADKLAFTVQPKWLYLFLVRLTGEYTEYLENARKYNASLGCTKIRTDTLSNWYDDLVKHFYTVIKPPVERKAA